MYVYMLTNNRYTHVYCKQHRHYTNSNRFVPETNQNTQNNYNCGVIITLLIKITSMDSLRRDVPACSTSHNPLSAHTVRCISSHGERAGSSMNTVLEGICYSCDLGPHSNGTHCVAVCVCVCVCVRVCVWGGKGTKILFRQGFDKNQCIIVCI